MKDLQERFRQLGTSLGLVDRIEPYQRLRILEDVKAAIEYFELSNYGTRPNIIKLIKTQLNHLESGMGWENDFTAFQSAIELAYSMYKWNKSKYSGHEQNLVISIPAIRKEDISDNMNWEKVVECYYIFRSFFWLNYSIIREKNNANFFDMYEMLDSEF